MMRLRFSSAIAGAFLMGGLVGAPASSFAGEEIELSRRDLVAQEGMNRSTEGVVMLGWMQLIVSVAGSALVLGSLEMSRRALALSREAMAAQHETAKHENRAYIGWSDPVVEIDKNTVIVRFKFKNFGNTPALNLRIWSSYAKMPGRHKVRQVVMPNPKSFRGSRYVPPGALIGRTKIWTFSNFELLQLQHHQLTIGAAIIIVYEDIYGETHALGVSEVRSGVGLARRNVDPAFAVDPAIYALPNINRTVVEKSTWWRLLLARNPASPKKLDV